MKRKLRIIFTAFIILLGCTKDFDGQIIDSFDFSFSGRNDTEGYVYQELNTSFSITPTREIKDAKFFFDYVITEGDGYFIDENGKIYNGEEIELQELVWNYSYVPTEIGEHKILFKAKDYRDNEVELELDYEVEFAPFTAILKSGTNKYIVNKKNELLLILLSENTSRELDSVYKVKYSVDGGLGTVYRDSTALKIGENIGFKGGNSEISYMPTTLGEHTISMVCISPDGFEKTVSQVIEVDNTTFFMSADAVNTMGSVGSDFKINVVLQTTDASDEVDYEMTYYFAEDSEGAGKLTNDLDETLVPATGYAIVPGNHELRFNADIIGKKKMYFDISDSNNQIKRDSVTFDYTTSTFDFSGSTPNQDISLNEPVTISFGLSGNGNGETYSLSYSRNNGNGTLKDGGDNEIEASDAFPVEAGNWMYTYTPTTLGDNNLVFVVTDDFGQTREVSIDFNVGDSFGFSLISDKNTYDLEEDAEIVFNVDGTDGYTATYSTDNDGVLTYEGSSYPAGTSFDIKKGTTKGTYQAFATGNHALDFTVVSETGETRTGGISFSYNEVDTSVDFSVEAERSTADVGETIGLDFTLTGDETYTAIYSNTNEGVLVYDGKNVGPGQTFTIAKESSGGTYTGNSNGGHGLSFTVTSDTGIEVFATETITFNNRIDDTITFSANQDSNSATVGQTVGIALTLGGDETYTATYSNSNSGNLEYQGTSIAPGTDFTIVRGNSLARYTGSSAGNHSLDFTVTSETGATASDIASVAYDVPVDTAITFSADQSVDTEEVGNSVDIYFNLTGNESYTATYINGNVGVFVYDGVTIGEGQTFFISQGSSSATYMGTASGTHNLEFTVTSDTGEIASDAAVIEFNEAIDTAIGFSADASESTSAVRNGVGIDFDLTGNETYTASYSNNSTGSFDYNGSSIAPGETFTIAKGGSSGTYVGDIDGGHTLNFTVTSVTGETASDAANVTFIEIVDTSFSFTANEASGTAEVGSSVDLGFDLNGNETYSATYANSSNGELIYNGDTIEPGQVFDIAVGISSATYSGTASGEHSLEFSVVSSTGATGSDSADITFGEPTDTTIAFSAVAESDTADVGDGISINFQLVGSETYTVSYTNNNTGSFVYDGSPIAPGDNFKISQGSPSGEYSGTESGDHSLDFTVVSDTGETASDGVSIAYDVPVDGTISFSADETAGTANVGQAVGIDFSLTGNETYTATYTNSNSGTLVYDGNEIDPGESFEIFIGNSSAIYNSTNAATHDLGFSVTSNTGNTASDNIGLVYTDAVDTTITFSAEPATASAEVGEDVGIDFNLSGDEEYTVSYTNSNTGTFTYGGSTVAPGQTFILMKSSSSGNYSGTANGRHNMDFTVTSNTNTTTSDIASIDYSTAVDTTITFSANAENGTTDFGNPVGIDFSLSGDETYTVAFTNSSTGTFTYDGSEVSPGESFTLADGPSSGSYTGSSDGVHELDFTVTSNTGVTTSDATSIAYDVPIISVTGISVSPTTANLDEGDNTTLVATVSPSDATTGSVSWSSGNTGVSTVDQNGVVTGIAAGSAIITVTTTDSGFTATSTVTVSAATVPVTGVSVSPDTASVTEGNNTNLIATVSPSDATDRSVSWSTDNPDVATVNSSGVVTGVSGGTATITVTTTDGGFTATSATTVNAATVGVTGVSVSPTTASVTEGNNTTLSATVSPSDATDRSVSWTSSNTGVATVTSGGIVTGVSAGSATITVTTNEGGFIATSAITVNAATVGVTGVSVSPTTASVTEGNNTSLSATVSPSNATDSSVSWTSSNTGVATVNGSGVVTGVSAGTAIITLTTTDGGFTATSSVTVTSSFELTSVSLSYLINAVTVSETGGFEENVIKRTNHNVRLVVSDIVTTNDAEIISYFIDGVEYPISIPNIPVGYVYEERTATWSAVEIYYSSINHDVNDNFVANKAGSGTVEFQVKDSNGNISNTIGANLPGSYSLEYPSNGIRDSFTGQPVDYTTLFNGTPCSALPFGNRCIF